MNTVMAAAGGGLVVVALNKYVVGAWSLTMSCNGAIAGMVAICAGVLKAIYSFFSPNFVIAGKHCLSVGCFYYWSHRVCTDNLGPFC